LFLFFRCLLNAWAIFEKKNVLSMQMLPHILDEIANVWSLLKIFSLTIWKGNHS
jgi:hypothetical protein